MIAFKVKVNGKRICVAGAEDLMVLAAHVTAVGELGKKTVAARPDEGYEIGYSVGGLTSRAKPKADVHLRWGPRAPLKIGDIVQVQVVETTKPDRPKSRTKASRPRK
jgi:hypothetical protein